MGLRRGDRRQGRRRPICSTPTACPARSWFPEARLNFAENLLRRRDDDTAMVFWGENKVRRKLSFGELYDQVSQHCAGAARDGRAARRPRRRLHAQHAGGDHRACSPASSIGAIWSSCSPDFGVQGVLDRFGQIEPKVLFCVDGYYYAGKSHRRCSAASRRSRASCPALERVVVVPYLAPEPALGDDPERRAAGRLHRALPPGDIAFERLPFNHPLVILYSSGHHRGAEVHRARRRRHAAAAPEGAPAAHRPEARRPAVLLHHLRLDDVELAGLGAGHRRDAAALRRLAVLSEPQTSCSTWPTQRA